jgi:hypothetical protein
MNRLDFACCVLGVALVGAACGPVRTAAPDPAGPLPAAPVAGPFGREMLRAVPVPEYYREALARGTRAAGGAPGERYWQNSVAYRIEAELDPESGLLRGSQRIVYRNRSPDVLPSLVLNLYQNIFSAGVPRNRFAPVTGGVRLERVVAQEQVLERHPANRIPITGDTPSAPVGYAVQGTLARLRLPRPLVPGDSVILEVDWEHPVPPAPNFRTAWEETLGSRVFHVAQWYPQIAVYDDLRGWATTPYLGDGEFYLSYGDFDVAITVPTGYLVGATGELMNPEEVLTEEARARLAAAFGADSVTRVVTAADLTADNATQHAIGGQLTWRFTAADVRDFAFSTSAGYVWDATRVRAADASGIPRAVALHALYRPEAPGWREAARFGQHALDFFGRLLVPYAYPQATIAEGPIFGMEYPMLVFIGKPPTAEGLYAVIAHELAHQWWPMMVGPDEAAHAWLDEGLATFAENLATADFFATADPFAADLAGYLHVAGSDVEVPLMRHTDLVAPYGARGVAAYSKPALLFRSLHWLLGADTFGTALATFTSEWLLRHPTPWDLFATFERIADRDLSWFFYPWWFETGVLDQAILSVEGAETGRALVTVADRGDIPAPALVVVTTAAGDTASAVIPVETWLTGTRTAAVTVEAPGPITRVVIDPGQIFPDADFTNNLWEVAGPR